jgi:CheY-like chemotaxis protein
MGPTPSRRPRVLIVDDEVLIGRVLARTLGQFADVAVAHSGSEALGKIAEATERFDLVICDVMMPGMCGPELFARVKEADPPTARAFIFVTGGASPSQLAEMNATGAPCMQKPLEVQAIRSLLRV